MTGRRLRIAGWLVLGALAAALQGYAVSTVLEALW